MKPGLRVQPKYLTELGEASGVISTDKANKKFYIVIIRDDKRDMSRLESRPDVQKLDSLTKAALEKIGIDTAKMADTATQDEMEKSLTSWLTGQERTLRSL